MAKETKAEKAEHQDVKEGMAKVKILGIKGEIDGRKVLFEDKHVWINGTPYKKDDEVDCTEADARVLSELGQAELLK